MKKIGKGGYGKRGNRKQVMGNGGIGNVRNGRTGKLWIEEVGNF